MSIQTQLDHLTVDEASQLRSQAGALLERLLRNRESSERRFAEAGKRDPMKFVTGKTALDSAITSVREMIRQMDSMLARMNGELREADMSFVPQRVHNRSQPKHALRAGQSAKSPSHAPALSTTVLK